MGSPRENIFYLKPVSIDGVITVRDGTEHKDFFISDGFIFFNQPSDGSGCCRAEISGVELVPKEALDKDRATQLLSEVQSAAKETEWDKVKAQLGTNLLNQVIKHAE
ncbi:ATP synthase subunit delta, mitochondrial [Perkinsus olseni]|uniref:ATP synthase subunit delta, mitochondrial n=1 Tax=Perkinsus olseni TaxID=32597 RepID=A0A7J6P8V6_PEROL|nr:ATP synthase subunit delta, mitochondrial [Perkinsus olseni]